MANDALYLQDALHSVITQGRGIWITDACGLTRAQTPIPALLHREAYAQDTPRTRIVLLGGMSGKQQDVELVLRTLAAYLAARQRLQNTIALSAVPCGNPDGLAQGTAPENGVGGRPDTGYPPEEHFFYDPHNPERRYLWRWIGMQAPDLILELRVGSTVQWESSVSAALLTSTLHLSRMPHDHSLLSAMGSDTPNGIGPIPGLRLTTPPEALEAELERLWSLLLQTPGLRTSPARDVLDARRARTPLEITRILAKTYGHTLEPVVYTQGMGISGRLRLARFDAPFGNPVPSIVELVEPYVSGDKELFGERAGTAALAGVIWTTQLAEATRDRRYVSLLLRVAERYRPGSHSAPPPPSDPDFRTEDMFMNSAILGRAFRLTGERRYLELLTPLLLHANTQQDNGLFWHARSTPYFWGRGNGFAALGFSEALNYLPEDHPDRPALLSMHVRHLQALRQYQHPSGLYPQVLNVPGSYLEFTVTCMVGYAMARAMRRGWIDHSYQKAFDLAWQGVTERIDDSGGLIDCCTNTGAQDSLQAYLDRPAVFGHDDRGGSMAMWFALEREQLSRQRVHTA